MSLLKPRGELELLGYIRAQSIIIATTIALVSASNVPLVSLGCLGVAAVGWFKPGENTTLSISLPFVQGLIEGFILKGMISAGSPIFDMGLFVILPFTVADIIVTLSAGKKVNERN